MNEAKPSSTKSIYPLISECAEIVRQKGDDYGAEDVLRCLRRRYPARVKSFIEDHMQEVLLRAIAGVLKRRGGLDLFGERKLYLAGFEELPADISFLRGDEVRFISTMKATPVHLESGAALRQKYGEAALRVAVEFRRAADFVRKTCGSEEATLEQALIESQRQAGAAA
jgi:hypothetical protein